VAQALYLEVTGGFPDFLSIEGCVIFSNLS
jgi:hypothetical protein